MAVTRLLAIPVVRPGTKCQGCHGDLDEHGDHALSCKKGTQYCMGSWKTKRHDGCCGALVHLGVAAGLELGKGIFREVRDAYSAKRPSDILVRHSRHRARGEEGDLLIMNDGGGAQQGAQQRHYADSRFRNTSYDVTIAATQKIENGQFGYSTAAHGPGTEVKKLAAAKHAKYKTTTAQSLPESDRRTRFAVLGFESSGYAGSTVRALVAGWETQAERRMGPGRYTLSGSCTRNELSSVIHYWNSVSMILRCDDGLLVRKSTWLGNGFGGAGWS